MKFCPTCQTRYDEEILRFCTKDGTPLIEENQPNFTALPSESSTTEDDAGEETVIRRKPSVQPDYHEKPPSAPRIVIPTGEERLEQPAQNVRTRPTAYQAPTRSNTGKVVLLTILGTIVILGGIGGVFWFLQSDKSNRNSNINLSNVNTNPPTNLNIGNAFNINLNANTNVNSANANANVNVNKTPTPRPTPTATPRPTPNANANTTTNVNAETPPVNARPTPSATPRPTETETPPVNRPVNVGFLNGRAVNLPTPAYPQAARTLRASGKVTVQVTVDQTGNVSSAKATSGHPLLRQAAEAAARQSRFNPIIVNNQVVAATGTLVYNFVY